MSYHVMILKKGEWKSAADRSTFHTEFMSEKINWFNEG